MLPGHKIPGCRPRLFVGATPETPPLPAVRISGAAAGVDDPANPPSMATRSLPPPPCLPKGTAGADVPCG